MAVLVPATIGTAATIVIVAAAEPVSDPIAWLVNIGVAGVWLTMFIVGKVRTEKEVQSLQERLVAKDKIIEQKDTQIATLQTGLVEKAIPALVRSTQIIEDLAPLLGRKL